TYQSGTGRLITQTVVKAGTTLGSFNLGYDQASNVTSREERVKSETGPDNADSGIWTYGYDAANRMISSTAPSTIVTTYGYDGAGNRTSVKVGAANPVTTSYDLAGLPTSSSDNTSYTHDAIGELTKIDKTGGTANDWNLVYSSWGVLKTAAHKTTGTPDVSYTADALDRVLSRVAGSTTAYTYRGTGEEAAKAQVGAATPVYYAFTPGGPLAQRTGPDGATLRYYLRDLHGDVVGFAATSGTNPMKGSILYSPWGGPGTKTGELATFPAQGHLGFQGQLTDALTGQVDMLTRYYEPTLGRFDTRDVLFGDPTDPPSLNLSVYAEDAPVTFTDPTGMKIELGEVGTAGPCSRACESSLAEASWDFIAAHPEVYRPSVDPAKMPPISSYYKVMSNPRLPIGQRVAAAKTLYSNYGAQGRSIAGQWLGAQQLANESSSWYQSWTEGLKQGVGFVNRMVSDRIARSTVGQVLGVAAVVSHRTLGLCGGGSATLPLAQGTASGCYQVTPTGEHGLTATLGGGSGVGLGANATAGLSVSNVERLQDLGGTFDYVDVSVGQGQIGGGVHYAWSTTYGHTTSQTIVSWSPGFRSNWLVAGYRGKTYTWTP
ncbi:MAG: RHS repeat-associated core domain-containing protein, partial [Gaiellales bacterium]